MKKVVIVHGYMGNPDSNWFPWLKSELEKLAVRVSVPEMPNSNNPKLKEWLQTLQESVSAPNEYVYLVGHSLGCPTILRYLEALQEGVKIGGCLLVAGFAEPLEATEVNDFVNGSWDDEKIKQTTREISLLQSTNDPYIPLAMAKNMEQRFNAKLQVIKNSGHFNEGAGFTELPEALVELKRMMSI